MPAKVPNEIIYEIVQFLGLKALNQSIISSHKLCIYSRIRLERIQEQTRTWVEGEMCDRFSNYIRLMIRWCEKISEIKSIIENSAYRPIVRSFDYYRLAREMLVLVWFARYVFAEELDDLEEYSNETISHFVSIWVKVNRQFIRKCWKESLGYHRIQNRRSKIIFVSEDEIQAIVGMDDV